MKPETLERAIKIKKELEELESLRRITYIFHTHKLLMILIIEMI